MHTLYNSDSFVVVSFDLSAAAGEGEASAANPARGGYEIVDKFARKEIFIEGALAQTFQQGVQALVEQRPDGDQEGLNEALDDYIAGFTQLAQQPVVLH